MSLQPNKILGAVLAVAVVALPSISCPIRFLPSRALKTPGYVIDMNAAPAVAATEAPPPPRSNPIPMRLPPPRPQQAAAAPAAPAAAGSDVTPIADRLKTADVAAGEEDVQGLHGHSFADSGASSRSVRAFGKS